VGGDRVALTWVQVTLAPDVCPVHCTTRWILVEVPYNQPLSLASREMAISDYEMQCNAIYF
jgi:hypothetical protein